MLGCFGWPATQATITRATTNNKTNKANTAWVNRAKSIIGQGFMFDCVCMIKAILWGWDGDLSKTYGGAVYASNGVPDIGADTMITKCTGVSTTGWANMAVGEAVWMPGHIGIYVGDGLAVECTPKWDGCVQLTAVGNIGPKAGYNTRTWTKHGKLPYVSYTDAPAPVVPSTPADTVSVGDIVQFMGGNHYPSSNSTKGIAVTAGPAKVTSISKGAKHPYHLVHTDGTSRVYGWVDANTISTGGAAKKYSVNATAGLNVRKGPGTTYAKVTALPYRTVVEVTQEQSGWGYVPAKGGWCSMQYLTQV